MSDKNKGQEQVADIAEDTLDPIHEHIAAIDNAIREDLQIVEESIRDDMASEIERLTKRIDELQNDFMGALHLVKEAVMHLAEVTTGESAEEMARAKAVDEAWGMKESPLRTWPDRAKKLANR